MLTIAGGVPLALRIFCKAMKPPKLVVVSEQDATSMAAFGAPALAHSASRVSSPLALLAPGSAQLFVGVLVGWTCVREPEGYAEVNPKLERKVFQSAVVYRSLSSTTTIVWPCPEMPALKAGLKL